VLFRSLIDARQKDWDVMAEIGHELQHALEVFSERNVRANEQIFFLFYKTYTGIRDRFETDDADRVGVTVLKELDAFARSGSTKGLSRPAAR